MPASNYTPAPASTDILHPDLTSFSDERSQGFSEKLLILGLEQKIDKMILKHLTVPKSEEVLKIKPKTNKHDGGMSKEHRNQLEKVSVAKTETI